jgi:hypothetical protein
MQKSAQKRAAAVGEYKEAFSRLMNDDVEGVPDLQAKAGADLREAERFSSRGSKEGK